MRKGSDPAFPNRRGDGLTKREYFAAMAMQGILARKDVHMDRFVAPGHEFKTPRGIAYQAALMADALLTEVSATAAEAGGEG